MFAIAYHPPKSVSHGHGARVRNARKAWDAIQEFLIQHTSSELRDPLKLKTWGPSQWTDEAVVKSVRAEAIDRFGPPTEISGEFYNWELPARDLAKALDFAFADDCRPKQDLGPVSLYVSYSFSWKNLPNPPGGTLSQHFGRGSKMGVSVGGRKVYIQPTFLFGASDEDPRFIKKLNALETSMPFQPKDTNYHRIEPKKSGPGEKLVKLPKGWKELA